jgi:hypothetical protein
MTPARKEGNRHRPLAAVVVIVTVLAAGYVFLAAEFSDWSGNHNVPQQFIVGAIGLLVVGLLVAGGILFYGNGAGKAGTK